MIKKINISLILVAIIGSLYFIFTKDDSIILVLKDLSIILTINALNVIQKIFKIKINDGINLLYIIFVFMAHFLGVTCELYNHIYWFDKFVHFLSGIVTSFIVIYILTKLKSNKSIIFNILFILSFTLSVAAFWEMFEYLCSYYFKIDPQKVIETGVIDTMHDILVAFLGSILVCICYLFEIKNKYNLLISNFIKKV